jgi:hypothetical protein
VEEKLTQKIRIIQMNVEEKIRQKTRMRHPDYGEKINEIPVRETPIKRRSKTVLDEKDDLKETDPERYGLKETARYE